jgi:hypothetical protein
VIDTGTNLIANNGTIAATGSGGLAVASAIDNAGLIDISDSHASLVGSLSGDGDVHLGGHASVEFGAGVSADLLLDGDATGLILFDHSVDFTGTISGFDSDDRIELCDIDWTLETSLSYAANADGSGGVLTISDGTDTAHLEFVGSYNGEGFTLGSDGHGGTLLGWGP